MVGRVFPSDRTRAVPPPTPTLPRSHSPLLDRVGLRVSELRRTRGFTQERLAELAGVSARYIQRVERGGENLGLRTIEKLALALGCEPADLLAPPAETPGVPRRRARRATAAR